MPNLPMDIADWLDTPSKLPKLIRDQIPQILSEAKVKFRLASASDESEFRAYLTRKLIEEAHEVNCANADREAVMQELADVMEVIDAICKEYGIHRDEVAQAQEGKRAGRGAFESRLILVECE